MESKKINQLATSVSPQTSDLTIIGDPITGVSKKITLLQIANLFATTGTVTSVAVTETGDALTITGSPITSAGTINIGFAGDATQYVRGDGALADFPTSTGGGSSVSYYLNSSVSQGTIGGVAYREFSKDPIAAAGTDITASTNGYIASYLTDANDPALLEVPAGNFNCEFYFSVNSNAHNPYVYAEVYKYDGTTFTLIGSSQSVPEYLTNGTTLSPYYFAIPVTQTTLAITDRIAIRIYVNVDTRVVTLHTENNHLCQVVTTFSKGLTSLNNLTRQVQFFATGTSGTDFNISSSTATHTFNIPNASATNRGLITTEAQTIAGAKVFDNPITGNSGIAFLNGVMPNITSNLYSGIGGNSQGISIITRPVSTNYTNNFYFPSASNSYTFPNATGTIALTSDLHNPVTIGTANGLSLSTQVLSLALASTSANGALSSTDWNTFNGKQAALNGTGFVKISGTTISYDNSTYLTTSAAASTYVTLGTTQTITGDKIFSGNNVYNGVNTYDAFQTRFTAGIAINQTLSGGAVSSHTVIGANVNGLNVNFPAGGYNSLNFASTSVGNTYTFPNATGTIALTSNLSAYLPLTGGTLTGALNGTSATFSGNMAIGSSTTALSPLQVVATGTIVRLGEQSGTTGKQFLIGIDGTSGRTELQSVWQGTGFTSLALQPSGGNVLIGTTSDNGAKLQVSGTSTFSSLISGTSATFSADFSANETSKVGISFASGYGQINSWGANTSTYGGLKFQLSASNGGTFNALTIAPTGAATFSSSVAIGGAGMGLTGINMPNQNYLAWYVSGGSGAQNVAIRGNGQALELSSGGGLTMTMDASQRVGIGTSSPYANLDLGASGANNIILRNLSNAYNLGYIGNSGGRMDIGFSNSNSSLAPLPYLSITSGGNVLIGTTTEQSYSKLVVAGGICYNNNGDDQVADNGYGMSFAKKLNINAGSGANTIYSAAGAEGALYVISGLNLTTGSRFVDLLLYLGAASTAPVVVSSNASGGAVIRSYTNVGENLTLSITGNSNTYTIRITAMGANERT
jgi:hypothetical protein